MPYRKKLIEVSLPLDAINKESAREKSIRHGHPSTLHLWWARRPLAACRAVLWSSLVDDPSEYMPDETSANAERERLFAILEELVKWENINNEEVLDKARLEIARSVARDLGVDTPVGKTAIRKFLAEQAPPVLDPFAGGGSIPLEAQRLGLRAYASDLNPVAVLINKALIEIPPKFAGMPPVHPPEEETTKGTKGKKGKKAKQGELWQREWKGAEGLAEDVRYYGKWMRDEAEKRIGHLYPKVKITAEMLAEREDLRKRGLKPGDELTVIAWLWARTVKCPNPACGVHMPLVRGFLLSSKGGKKVWIEPFRRDTSSKVDFKVKIDKTGNIPAGTVNRQGARCIVCNTPVSFDYIRTEGQSGRIGSVLLAEVAEGNKGRHYFSAVKGSISIANLQIPNDLPDSDLPDQALGFRVQLYGMKKHWHLFTHRQLHALFTFSNLVKEAQKKIETDVEKSLIVRDTRSLRENGNGSRAYLEAITVYLAIAVSRSSDYWSSLCGWHYTGEKIDHVFRRQTLSMNWDFAEANPFSNSSGNWLANLEWPVRYLNNTFANQSGVVDQRDARIMPDISNIAISTDPPYYDNVGYADLADYFYIWLRPNLKNIYPDIFGTLLTPKENELIATPFRHNNNMNEATAFFEEGLEQVFASVRRKANPQIPITVYYAFKQTEQDEEEAYASSTGWETILHSLLRTGFEITGTWPVRTEMAVRLRNISSNALASSIVLVCRSRSEDSPTATRREFLSALKRELPPALRQLQLGNIAPVDLAQAAIGPGMAIFSRYKAVLESDGSPMRVRAALALINQALDEYLAEQEGEYDGDTRWALAWYEQYGHDSGPYGVAETLSKAKNTSVEGLERAGFLEARAGKVRLLRRGELAGDWDPAKDKRLTAWDAAQHLIRALDKDGEAGAGALLEKLGAAGQTARDLAYRLYTVCERKGWAQEALAYNMLVVAWPRIKDQAGKQTSEQRQLL